MPDLIAKVFTSSGVEKGEVALAAEMFGIEPNVAVMHQVVTAQRAAGRSGERQHQDPSRGTRWRS